jgi:hypothetical protein
MGRAARDMEGQGESQGNEGSFLAPSVIKWLLLLPHTTITFVTSYCKSHQVRLASS